MTKKRIPVACTLQPADAADQVDEWVQLRAQAHTIESLSDGVAMSFAIGLAEAVEDLAVREASCCGFLSLVTERSETSIRLTITAQDPDGQNVIAMLAGTT